MDTDLQAPQTLGEPVCVCIRRCVPLCGDVFVLCSEPLPEDTVWASGKSPDQKVPTASACGCAAPMQACSWEAWATMPLAFYPACSVPSNRPSVQVADREKTQDLISGLGLVLPCGLVRAAQLTPTCLQFTG